MIFNTIQRFRHSRGYGVHSPFAFNFITNVVYEKHWYYAFSDLEFLLLEKGIDIHDYSFHHLSYRLIRFFKPKQVLEIGFNTVANSLFICHSDKDLLLYIIERDDKNKSLTSMLSNKIKRQVIFVDSIQDELKFDSIFVNLDYTSDAESLFNVSSEESFWVLAGINTVKGRKLWKAIVKDARVNVSFNMKDVGIVVLNKSYEKQNYLI